MWRKVLFILPIASLVYGSPLKSKKVYDFSKGLDTYHSSLSLPDGFVQSSDNILFDANAPIAKRQGFTLSFTTKTYSGQTTWTYVDSSNTAWIIVRETDTVVANNLSGTASVKIATVSLNNVVGEVNAFGFAYFVDQTQGVYYWNGSSTTYVGSTSPLGSLITQFHGRLWVSGLAIPNGNQLYGSKQYDGNTWATGVNPNDPVVLTVGLQDNFDGVTALYPFLDTLYIFKHYLTYALYGFDQTNFQTSFITAECGCIDTNSIQTYNHTLTFVSERGVEAFNGYTCTRISDPVKNMVDASIQAGSFSQQTWLQSANADWSAGTFTPSVNLSTAVANPALAVSTFTVSFDSYTWNVPNNGFERSNGELTVPTGWTHTGTGSAFVVLGLNAGSCVSASPRTGRWLLDMSTGAVYAFDFRITEIINANTGVQLTGAGVDEISATDQCGWHKETIQTVTNDPTTQSQVAQVRISLANRSNVMTSSTFTVGSDVTYYFQEFYDPIGGLTHFVMDDFQSGASVYTTSASLVGFATGYITVSSVGGASITVQGSTGTVGPWANVLTTTGTSSAFLAKSYIHVISSFTRSATDSSTTDLTKVTVTAVSTGAFKSQIKNLGTINSFGNFLANTTLNSGAIAFTVCSSTFSTMAAPVSCTSPSANTQITNTVVTASQTYVQWYATFTVTGATQTPTLNSGSIQWFSGTHAPPMASTVWDNRYWLSLTTTTTDSINDGILVLNSKGAWSLFDIHAGGLTQYKGSLYHSDSNSTGNVYLDNQGYNDNGTAINAFVKTKDYCGEDINTEDYYESLYLSEDNLGSFNTSVGYQMDRSTPTYSLSSVNQVEFSHDTSVKVPFVLSSNQNFGKCANFTFTESDLSSPWNFYGFTVYSHPREIK